MIKWCENISNIKLSNKENSSNVLQLKAWPSVKIKMVKFAKSSQKL